MKAFKRLFTYVRNHGAAYTLKRLLRKTGESCFGAYDRQYKRMRTGEDELALQRANQPHGGLISVIVPVYNVRASFLLDLVYSLHAQTLENWEACLYDGGSDRAETLDALRRAQAMDPRIRVRLGKANEGISGNSNRALSMARGEYVALCDHDDLLTPDALWRMARAIEKTNADMLYSDEDKITENGKHLTDPHLKSDFCPDSLRSGNYICHLMVIRRSLIERVGGFRGAFDGSQDHDLALRCAEAAARIEHVPHVLYHWRTFSGSVSHLHLARCMDAACRAVEEHMNRIGYPGTARMEGDAIRLRYEVRDGLSLAALILRFDGQSDQPLRDLLLSQKMKPRRIQALTVTPQTWQQALTQAFADAREDLLLVIDACARPLAPDFTLEMAMYAQRHDVGAVTPAILRGKRLVCAGYALMDNGALAGRNAGLPLRAGGDHLLTIKSHNVAAVSSLCFMVRRDHALPLRFPGRFDDTAMALWCKKLRENGLVHVYTPHAAMRAERMRRALVSSALPAGLDDPCISRFYRRGSRADFRIRFPRKHEISANK